MAEGEAGGRPGDGEGPRRGEDHAAALARALKAEALRLGFDQAGITTPEPTGHLDAYRRWLEEGYHGEMDYLARPDAVERRGDLGATLEGVRSVVVVAHEYNQEDPPGIPDDPSLGVIARYARGRDYHKVVEGKLRALGRWLEAEVSRRSGMDGEAEGDGDTEGVADAVGDGEAAGNRGEEQPVRWRAYVDTGPILERDLARRAGLGWFGKNTMILHPRKGSYYFLGVLLLDVELPADEPFRADHCGTCTACLDACPTGALLGRDDDGAPVMDARLCISYLTIEHRGPIPEELRPAMGNRIYGCDICQEVCPFNVRFAEEADEPGYAARGPGELPTGVETLPGDDVSAETHPGTEAPGLVDLLETALDEGTWDTFSRGSAIRRAGRSGFARNVCVALGNWASSEAVPPLVSALSDPEPLVRGHAAWALGQVASQPAVSALEGRLEIESDSSAQDEIRRALSSARDTSSGSRGGSER